MKKQAFLMWDNISEKAEKIWKSPIEVLMLCVCCVRKFFEKQLTMPRLTVAQRTWVCIEFARVGNAHEVSEK